MMIDDTFYRTFKANVLDAEGLRARMISELRERMNAEPEKLGDYPQGVHRCLTESVSSTP